MQTAASEEKQDPTLLASPEDWANFVARELNDTHEAYLKKPDFLLGHSRTERQTSADYAGRELLELVQNAADAAAEAGGAGKVLIEVTQDGLFVANSGQPFRTGGVSSLMTAHTSDKPTRAAKMIGAKGLGFRAILNWTEAPLISSGELEIGFSRVFANAQVSALAIQNRKIGDLFTTKSEESPPLLVFPATGAELERLGDDHVATMLLHTRALRKEGFDTVVAAPFHERRAFDRAIEQASQFEPSFLLFVKSLDSICIRFPDEQERVWSKEIEENGDVTLYLESGPDTGIQSWILRHKQGSIGDGKAERQYELAIALRLDEESTSGRLHSYFPTSLPLPFNGLFHATLELDSNRKTIQEDSDLNEGVLTALGEFHAETLNELRQGERLNGNPLSWLVVEEGATFPDSLEIMAESTWRRTRELPLIEGLDGVWRTASESKIGPHGYSSFIPSRLFGELVKVEDENVEQLLRDKINVPEINPKKILKRLREGSLNIQERARAIVGVASSLPEEHHDRRLFLDINSDQMPAAAIPFPPPSKDEQRRSLPAWSSARFIHPELWEQLVDQAPGSTLREKLSELKGFRVTEFSVDSVISALRTKLGELLKSGHPEPDRIQSEFLTEILILYDEKRNRPTGLVNVRCKDGSWRDVTTVHLSEHYGQSGRINAELYKADPELLVAAPDQNGLANEGVDLTEFLIWLGINQWPRKMTEPLPSRWEAQILQDLPASFTVSDGNKFQELQRDQLQWGYTIRAEFETVEKLDEILLHAPSDAILAWLSQDERLDPIAPVSEFTVSVQGRSSGNASFRAYQGPLPNIVRHSIQQSEWLVCRDKKKHSPQNVMTQPGALSVLFNSPKTISAESEADFGLSPDLLRRGLERAGVARGLGDIPESQVYRLLLSLPMRNIKPELASRLYLQLLEREVFDPEKGGADREAFLKQGRVPVQTEEGCSWGARADTYYAHRDDLPEAARPHLTLIDLPSRRNATQVEARFGISALRKGNMGVRVLSVEAESGNLAQDLNYRFDQARPFILALRYHLSPEEGALRRLKALDLAVARRVEMELSINDRHIVNDLEPFKHTLKDGELIVTIDSTRPNEENVDLGLHAISDGLAELFELQSNADFTSLLTASSPALRKSHLKRALPRISSDELEAALSGVGYVESTDMEIGVDAEMLAQGPSEPSQNKATVPRDAMQDQESIPQAPEANDSIDERKNVEPGELRLKAKAKPSPEVDQALGQNSGRAKVRVSGTTGRLGNRNPKDVEQAADAEKWTVAFEVSQKRYPLLVAHLQGKGAFGCDCLSFVSEDDLRSFQDDPGKIELVDRFIETKSGAVRFTKNEWDAAEKLGNRYFAYRVSFSSGQRDKAQLTIVQNPRAQLLAIRVEHELLMERVNTRDEFELFQADS